MAFCLQRSAARLLWRESRPSLLSAGRTALPHRAAAYDWRLPSRLVMILRVVSTPTSAISSCSSSSSNRSSSSLLTAEQADKSGTEILLRFSAGYALRRAEETFFCRFFLLLSQPLQAAASSSGAGNHYRRLFCRFGPPAPALPALHRLTARPLRALPVSCGWTTMPSTGCSATASATTGSAITLFRQRLQPPQAVQAVR
ncbi:Uncharacterised protein [Klebsiella pneumoniae subsp. ozaenae]|uniref:Uncharacterized protein n=1 Tax=Klebsiella pneumoniae subsp. ozaenae TaxID=574 RepID=A0A378AMS1_KLEPO|nr:Uncharacterised protein [Klebsiella pneumoniae subsp. ozaenae]